MGGISIHVPIPPNSFQDESLETVEISRTSYLLFFLSQKTEILDFHRKIVEVGASDDEGIALEMWLLVYFGGFYVKSLAIHCFQRACHCRIVFTNVHYKLLFRSLVTVWIFKKCCIWGVLLQWKYTDKITVISRLHIWLCAMLCGNFLSPRSNILFCLS